jgi:TPR repeat protein
MAHEISQCFWPWFEAFVHVNGNVKPCCYATGTVGNLADHTLEEIWRGPAMQELRAYVEANRIHPVCSGATCVYIRDRVATGETDPAKRMEAMADAGSHWAAFAFGQTLVSAGEIERGVGYLRKASQLGHPGAPHSLAIMMMNGRGVLADKAGAIALLEKSAKQKNTPAMLDLGIALSKGDGGVVDGPRAASLLKEAGERGADGAWFHLGQIHECGKGVPVNLEEARRFYGLGARRGDIEAKTALARIISDPSSD